MLLLFFCTLLAKAKNTVRLSIIQVTSCMDDKFLHLHMNCDDNSAIRAIRILYAHSFLSKFTDIHLHVYTFLHLAEVFPSFDYNQFFSFAIL